MSRRPDLSEADQMKLVNEIQKDIWNDLQGHEERLRKRAAALADTFMLESEEKQTPWPGASNVKPNLVAKSVRAITPRMVNAVLGMEPIPQAIPVNPRDPQAKEDAEARADYLDYQIRNEIPRFKREIYNWINDTVHGGDAVIMPWFEERRTLVPERLVLDNFRMISETDFIQKTDEDVLSEVFDQRLKTKKRGGHSYSVTFIEKGFEQTADVSISRDEPDVREDQLEVVIEKEELEQRLRVSTQNAGDWITPPSACGYQYDDAHHVSRRFYLHPDSIREDSNFHNLTEDDLDKLEKLTGKSFIPEDDAEEIKDELLGVEHEWGISGIEETHVLILEHYRPYLLNGRLVEMIFWAIPALWKLGRWEYHRTVFAHGKRPVVDLAFIPVTGRPYGIGIYHLVKQYQDEIEIIINQMNDRENLVNNPVILYEQTARLNANAFRSRAPGDAFQVGSVDKVRPLEWRVNPHGGFPMVQYCQGSAEEVSGSAGGLGTGVQPTRPNAPRTARGTLALIGESNIVIESHVMLLHEAFSELLHQMDGLNEQYFPPERQFMITGKQQRTLTRPQFRTRVRFFLSGNTVNTNPQVRMAQSELLYQALEQNIFFTGAYLQLDPLSIEGQYRKTDHFIREHVQGRDASFLLFPLEQYVQEAEAFQQAMQQAQEEKNQIQREQAAREMDRKDLDSQVGAFGAAQKKQQADDDKLVELLKG